MLPARHRAFASLFLSCTRYKQPCPTYLTTINFTSADINKMANEEQLTDKQAAEAQAAEKRAAIPSLTYLIHKLKNEKTIQIPSATHLQQTSSKHVLVSTLSELHTHLQDSAIDYDSIDDFCEGCKIELWNTAEWRQKWSTRFEDPESLETMPEDVLAILPVAMLQDANEANGAFEMHREDTASRNPGHTKEEGRSAGGKGWKCCMM